MNNPANNPQPAALCSQIAGKGASLDPLALGVLVDSSMKVYLCPQCLALPLGQAPHQRYNQFHVFDSNLLDRDTYHATIPNGSYDVIPNNLLVPTLPTITAAIGADPNLVGMGPYQPGNPNIKTVRVCRITPLPFAYVPIFLPMTSPPGFILRQSILS